MPWRRSLTHRVLIAFVITSGLAVMNVLLVRSLLKESDGVAATLNVVGKMGMLGQRIALDALAGALGTETRAPNLMQQKQPFEQAQQVFSGGGARSDHLMAVGLHWRAYRETLAKFMRHDLTGDMALLRTARDPASLQTDAGQLLDSTEALLDALLRHGGKLQQKALYSVYGLFLLNIILLLAAYWWVSHRLLRPMDSLLAQCRELSAGNYAVRSMLRSRDELGRLGKALNDSAAHVERLCDEIARERASLALAEASARRAALVYAHASEAMVVTDENGYVQDINPAFTEITGYSAADIVGKRMNILSSGRHGLDFYQGMWRSLLETGRWSGDIWNRRKSGEEYVGRLKINTSYNENGSVNCRSGLFSDVTERCRREASIWRQAHYDHLTQLPNRQMFQASLQDAIDESRISGLPFALMFLDLDLFKKVNDTFGHDQGDELLRQVARRLGGCVRNSDLVARLGGDEFTLIIRDLPHYDQAQAVCRKVLNAAARPYDLGGQEAIVSASMGVVFYPSDGIDAAELLKRADRAMYASKAKGRNQYCRFTPNMLVEGDPSLFQAG